MIETPPFFSTVCMGALCLAACSRPNPDFLPLVDGPRAGADLAVVDPSSPRDAGADLRSSDLASVPADLDGSTDLGDCCGTPVWSIESSGTTQTLLGIWGSGPGDIYAVGTGGTLLHSVGDGSWTAEHSGTTQELVAAWGSGPGDVYVVGWGGTGGTLLHSSGNGLWIAEASGSSAIAVSAIWGSSASDVYALSASSILHSTGDGSWETQAVAPTMLTTLLGISGRNAADLYVVGYDESVMNGGTVLHSAGTRSWTTLSAGTANLYQVWVSDGGEVYAVGAQGTILHSIAGGAWTPEPSGTSGPISAVWGSSRSDVFAVGGGGLILHSTGNGAWTAESSNTFNNLSGVWGSGPGDVYAVADEGLILHRH